MQVNVFVTWSRSEGKTLKNKSTNRETNWRTLLHKNEGFLLNATNTMDKINRKSTLW